VGNIRGKRKGTTDLPPVVMGSHLDTVPCGGHYDGTIGILGGLAVIRKMNERQIKTHRPVEVMNFSCEESSRFRVGTLGSKIMAGRFPLSRLRETRDADGISLHKALTLSGYAPETLETAMLSPDDLYAFIELHIEQGPVLESENNPVGIVTDIAAPTRFKVVIQGLSAHSGSTPMSLRKDALTGACELILGVENIATNKAGPHTVGTVGFALIEPGAMNVIPGRVEIGIDIRDISK
ncbi:MAG: M20 family metallo-hydrolase, partial [bacterium]|nr:M20 family metallo-hydrolase [bacterium]